MHRWTDKQRYLISLAASGAVHCLPFVVVGVLSLSWFIRPAERRRPSRSVSSHTPEKTETLGGLIEGGRQGIPGEIRQIRLVWLPLEKSKEMLPRVAAVRTPTSPRRVLIGDDSARTVERTEVKVPGVELENQATLAAEVASPAPSAATPAGDGFGDVNQALAGGRGESSHQRIAQERISHVAQLIGNPLARRVRRSGSAKVSFRSNEMGYVEGLEIAESAGIAAFDREVPTILHLAEPYPQNEEYRVVVKFECIPAM